MLVAINRFLVGKVPDSIRKFNHRFENANLDAHELASSISNGYAFSAQHKGSRKSANVTGTGFLAVDIDEGLTIEAAEADPFFQAYASILYTTASHTQEAPRFRIIFELEEPLTDPTSIRIALTGLTVRFGGDRACTDAGRLYFGSPGCEPRIYGKKLPALEIERLIQQAEDKAVAKRGRRETGSRTSVRSRMSIPVSTKVTTAAGAEMSIWEVPEGTKIYCPQHVDTKPSAFVAYTSAQKPCIFCSACDTTYFPDGFRPDDNASFFDYDWDRVLKITTEEYLEHYDEANNVSLSDIRGYPITVQNDRYLPDNDPLPAVVARQSSNDFRFDYGTAHDLPLGLYVSSDVLLIKSPKGTGKTELLKNKVAALKAAGVSILVISHRRSLLFASAARLGVTNYMRANGTWQSPTKAYSICLDSLGKVKPVDNPYDVVIIDECEQVFSHLLSATMREGRRVVLMYLQHYIRAARQVILLDADLSKLTLDVMTEITVGQNRTPEVIINHWKPTCSTVNLYDEAFPNQLVGELVESLSRGERCYVCSNSKRDINLLAQQIPLHVDTKQLKTICITSENSQSEEIQHFIQNISTEILNYDVVFTSPSMSTGIDITFPGDLQEIDAVYGIFHPLVTTHLEIDQQLARVRSPKRVCVWVSKDEFNFETDPSVIKAEILASEHEHHVLIGTDETGRDKFLADPVYDAIFASVTAMQRASKNALRRHFIRYKEANNWTISVVPHHRGHASLGAKVLAAGRAVRDDAERGQIIAAEPISGREYGELQKRSQYSPLETDGVSRMRRFELETFYGQEVDAELLAFDKKGRGRAAVRNLFALLASDEEIEALDEREAGAFATDRRQWSYRKRVLTRLLSAAGLLAEGGIVAAAEVDSSKLGAFIVVLQDEKAAVQRLFDVSPRRDSENNPVRQLSDVLKIVGLKLVTARRDQSGGKDRIARTLDPKALSQMMGYVDRRRKRNKADRAALPGDIET